MKVYMSSDDKFKIIEDDSGISMLEEIKETSVFTATYGGHSYAHRSYHDSLQLAKRCYSLKFGDKANRIKWIEQIK